MEYKHITTVIGLRKVESLDLAYAPPMLEITLEDDLQNHVVCLEYDEWVGKVKLGDGITLIVREEPRE